MHEPFSLLGNFLGLQENPRKVIRPTSWPLAIYLPDLLSREGLGFMQEMYTERDSKIGVLEKVGARYLNEAPPLLKIAPVRPTGTMQAELVLYFSNSQYFPGLCENTYTMG